MRRSGLLSVSKRPPLPRQERARKRRLIPVFTSCAPIPGRRSRFPPEIGDNSRAACPFAHAIPHATLIPPLKSNCLSLKAIAYH